jgi:hypothetical protein
MTRVTHQTDHLLAHQAFMVRHGPAAVTAGWLRRPHALEAVKVYQPEFGSLQLVSYISTAAWATPAHHQLPVVVVHEAACPGSRTSSSKATHKCKVPFSLSPKGKGQQQNMLHGRAEAQRAPSHACMAAWQNQRRRHCRCCLLHHTSVLHCCMCRDGVRTLCLPCCCCQRLPPCS